MTPLTRLLVFVRYLKFSFNVNFLEEGEEIPFQGPSCNHPIEKSSFVYKFSTFFFKHIRTHFNSIRVYVSQLFF